MDGRGEVFLDEALDCVALGVSSSLELPAALLPSKPR
jgi:hypothetical protein